MRNATLPPVGQHPDLRTKLRPDLRKDLRTDPRKAPPRANPPPTGPRPDPRADRRLNLGEHLRNLSTIQLAFGASMVFHAALLAVRLSDGPESFNHAFRETPLEIVLVNAKVSNERPDRKVPTVAQASLAGGGNLDQGRSTSPLPASTFTAIGNSVEDSRRQVDELQARQMLLLAQIKQQLATMPAPDPRAVMERSAEASAQENKRRQLIELLAEIERRVNEENSRPRKRYLSPSTREAAYALYVDTLRRRIEARGTENFPESGGKKLYGTLRMMITVNFDGSILSTDIVESSGNKDLDRRAQAIVHSIGSFGRFTDAMRRQTDQIVLVSRFTFTHEETLETQLSSGQ
jgi:protein TonB